MGDLRREIEAAINRHSAENGSDTPDFILAQYLLDSLDAFDKAVKHRRLWWGDKERTGRALGGDKAQGRNG